MPDRDQTATAHDIAQALASAAPDQDRTPRVVTAPLSLRARVASQPAAPRRPSTRALSR